MVATKLDGPIVVLSPHLDDAVLSAWSILRLPPTVEVQVVVVFAGVPPAGTSGAFDPLFGTTDSHRLVHERRAEDHEAMARTGRPALHLDLLDEQYRTAPLAVSEVESAISDAIGSPATLVLPAGLGRHLDHVLARDGGAAIAERVGARIVRYADLPYAANLGWPAWVTGEVPDPNLVPDARWHRVLDEVGSPDRSVEVVRFDDAERSAKLDALRCYRSQFPALDAGPIGRLTNPAVSSYEVRWLD